MYILGWVDVLSPVHIFFQGVSYHAYNAVYGCIGSYFSLQGHIKEHVTERCAVVVLHVVDHFGDQVSVRAIK